MKKNITWVLYVSIILSIGTIVLFFEYYYDKKNKILYLNLLVPVLLVTFFIYILYLMNMRVKHQQIKKDAVMRKQLTQQIAHEIKTPLSSIVGYIETLQKNKNITIEKQKYFLDRCLIQAHALNSLLQDILLLYKIDDMPQLYTMEKIHLNLLLDEIIQDTQMALIKKNMNIFIHLKKPIWIHGNNMLLYSIFRNLINNAIAYAGERKVITLEIINETSHHYTFLFYDNGNGISEKHLPHIFERFYRVDKGRSRAAGGTGLGLSIVKHAVEMQKGDIQAFNRKKGGLEFIIRLPK